MECGALPVAGELDHIAGTGNAVLTLARIDRFKENIRLQAEFLADFISVAYDHADTIHTGTPCFTALGQIFV